MQKSRRQQRSACEACRRRKVRCDVDSTIPGGPCSVCRKSKVACLLKEHWPAPRRARLSTAAQLTPRSEPGPLSLSTESNPSWEISVSDTAVQLGTPSHADASSVAASVSTNASDRPDILARTGLNRFFLDGVNSTNWRMFEADNSFRLAYIGSPVSNLAQLVRLRLTLRSDVPDHEPSLHYPYPQIRPPPNWKPDNHEAYNDPTESSEDLYRFPIHEVREALVNAFFDQVHPTFPVISKTQFFNHDKDPSWKPPPPLLYQAVLLVGAHVCTHRLVERDRWMVKAILFRKASMLYHLRQENDRLYLTQAALLFTWHVNDGDTVAGGLWYWSGIAARLACGQGFHRDNPSLPILERIMHKRTWWYAVILEVFSALETGRPCSIHWVSIDQTMPSEEDMSWDNTSVNGGPMSKYLVGMICLARIGLDIIEMNYPNRSDVSVASIDNRLASWSIQTQLGTDLFSRQLELHYSLLVLYLHRSHTKTSETSRQACTVASDTICNILDQMSSRGELSRCHFTVSAVTAVSIFLTYEIRTAIENEAYSAAAGLLNRLQSILEITRQLLRSWPNAEAVHSVFDGLKREYEQSVTHHVCESAELVIPETSPDWSRLFASTMVPTEQYDAQLNWLELINETQVTGS